MASSWLQGDTCDDYTTAVYHAVEMAKRLPADAVVLVCLSGRGDKDLEIVAHTIEGAGS